MLKFFDTHYIKQQTAKKQALVINDIEPALNNILASVHQRIKYNPKAAVPRIPKAIKDTMPQKGTEVFMTRLEKPKQKKRGSGKRNIAQLQADRENHSLLSTRQTGRTSDTMTYQGQQRYREVLRQKRLLENMLQEHQKLQSDRDSIACEINYMRSYLDSIRDKLDVSLKKLNSQKTITDQSCPNKKPTNRLQSKTTKNAKKPANVSPPTKLTNPTSRQGRIPAGGQSDVRPIAKPSIANKDKRLGMSQSMKKRADKRWVYCPKIERKNDSSNRL